MTPEEQQKKIIQLEQKVLEAAIVLYEKDRYDDLYELRQSVDRLLDFKAQCTAIAHES